MKADTIFFKQAEAVDYGVDCAIFLHTLRYWIAANEANQTNQFDGKTWATLTASGFLNYFSFYSKDQVKRILKKLLDKGLIIKRSLSENPWDRTMSYALSDLTESIDEIPTTGESENAPCTKGDSTPCTKGDSALSSNTKGKEDGKEDGKGKIPYREVIDMFNQITGQKLGRGGISETYKIHIRARFKDGFTIEDFKHVITVKFHEWKGDNKTKVWIRPQTLFGAKFETYLQQTITADLYGVSKPKGIFE